MPIDATGEVEAPFPQAIPRGLAFAAVAMLTRREIVRFLRQRNRVIGAFASPVVFWLLFGTGLHGSFQVGADGPSFLEYYFPGTLVLILLFTAIFATISVIEDRREGFLQGVLVAPIPRWAMVLGKVGGGASLALLQGLTFLVLALGFQIEMPWQNLPALLTVMVLAAISLNAMGLVIAWRMDSTQGFHAIMNLVLMPMWLLSGSFFPVPARTVGMDIGQLTIHWCMRVNPLTYTLAEVRRLVGGNIVAESVWTPSPLANWTVTLAFTAASLLAAWYVAGRETRGAVK